MHRQIRPWIASLAMLAVVITACGGSAAPTASTAVPSATAADPSAGVQPTDAPAPTDAPVPTDAPAPTDAPDPTEGASPAGTAAAPDPAIPTDPALLGTGFVPDGWQIVEDATTDCRIAVPPDWTTGVAPGTGTSSVLAEALGAVSSAPMEWEAYKQTVDQFYLSGHSPSSIRTMSS